MQRDKNVVITGATGTIGMALTELLLDRYDCAVTVLVNPDSRRRKHLEKFESNGAFRVLEARLEDYGKIGRPDFGEPQDCFFHLAWAGSDTDRREDAVIQSSNIRHELDAVALAERIGCQVFVGAGSQAEYGRCSQKVTSRTATCPESAYGMAKLCAGYLSRVECRRLGLRHVWMRVLSVYGPYNGEDAMIISAIRKMLRGEKTVFSRGEQIWDYLYAEDAAEAFWRAAICGKDGAVYPLGSGEERPLAEYIRLLHQAANADAGIDIGGLPYRPDQMMYLCADISELTADTGFLPRISFEEGIRRTVAWCKE